MNLSTRASRWEAFGTRPSLQRILAFDERLFIRLATHRVRGVTGTMRLFTHLADPLGLLLLAGVAVWVKGGTPAWLVPSLLAGLMGTLIVNVLKRWLCRPRPDVAIEGFSAVLNNPDAFAFPSGHTAAAFSSALAFGWWHPELAPLALLAASGVGLSRVYLGAHYPLDVATGAVIGSASTLAIVLL